VGNGLSQGAAREMRTGMGGAECARSGGNAFAVDKFPGVGLDGAERDPSRCRAGWRAERGSRNRGGSEIRARRRTALAAEHAKADKVVRGSAWT